MYEKDTDAKIDELTSLVKAIDTKIKFLMDDMDEIKAALNSMGDTVVQTAVMLNQTVNKSTVESQKAARLEAFREQTSRW